MKDIQPLVSVIMPAYNSEKYIGKSIESVLAQDYQAFELLIIDDGSKDRTKNIAEQYAERDARIRVFSQPNQGVSVARNKGLDVATGKYVAFLDSDDWWDANNLSNMVKTAENTQSGIICAGFDMVNIDGTRETFNNNKDGELLDFVTDTNEIRLFFWIGSVMLSRDILEKYHIRFDTDIVMAEDIGFYIKLFAVTNLKSVPLVMAHYCRHENSATTAVYNPDKYRGTVEIFRHAEPYMQKYRSAWIGRYQKIWDYYAYRFVWTVIKNGMYDEGLKYIEMYNDNLKRFRVTGHKVNDRLKCSCLLMKQKWIMKLLTGFAAEK